jgi:hypothetical protein
MSSSIRVLTRSTEAAAATSSSNSAAAAISWSSETDEVVGVDASKASALTTRGGASSGRAGLFAAVLSW